MAASRAKILSFDVKDHLYVSWISVVILIISWVHGTADTALVNYADTWRYRKGISAPPPGWKTIAEADLDASWLTGPGGIGYADNTSETQLCKTLLGDMNGNYTTVAMRRSFQVDGPVDPTSHLQLTMDFDDGFIAWLDDAFLTAENTSSAPAEPSYDAVASATHESSHGNNAPNPPVTYDLGPVASRLTLGAHILSIVGLNQSSSSSDFIQVPTLSLVTNSFSSNCLSGFLTTDTTWQAINSPYQICGNFTVSSNVTLTIEPGTTIVLGFGVNLTVAKGGRLIAEGNETNRIHFTRAPGVQAWGGITIIGAGSSPETRLAYVDFDGNSTVCLAVAGGTLYLD